MPDPIRLRRQIPIPQQPNPEMAQRLAKKMMKAARGDNLIDILSASFGVTIDTLLKFSPNLPTAMDNVDKLAVDMKNKLLMLGEDYYGRPAAHVEDEKVSPETPTCQ